MIGEAVTIEVGLMVKLDPPVTTYSEYSIQFILPNGTVTEPLPISNFQVTNSMQQRPIPTAMNVTQTGQVNLSSGKQFDLVFDGYNHPFVQYLADMALDTNTTSNNDNITMIITREQQQYTYIVVVADHSILIANDTTNEVHKLKLSTRPDIMAISPSKQAGNLTVYKGV
jgi:hypothetical protein